METRFISPSPNNYVFVTVTPQNTVCVWIFSPPQQRHDSVCAAFFFALINVMSESDSHFQPFSHVGALTGV